MPIVASGAGNTGNQTLVLLIRGLAMDQINRSYVGYLWFEEAAVSDMNAW